MRWACEIERVGVTFSNNAEWRDTLHSVLVAGQPTDLHTVCKLPGEDPLPCMGQAVVFIHWCQETQNYYPRAIWAPSRHPFYREAIGTSGSHWLFHLLRTFGKYFLLSKVCDKYLVALWGFWVKLFGKEWLIVLGLWWVTWTFRVCSLNIG